ncbi:monovalent cation/H(+) antiporter subunit G [Pyrococcus abyssi]|uniref:Monovalent cation/proton antiporter, MnhG/PhaG subunit subfamily n=1 Tax=Pyrococcus abyssi (strain GE5 / Orsay) TaxID=272844 RepID=Q9UYN7_PYRAB|nr:monovalent cation/H(+) antiporter subunit G [Pyrococcus abyssi]CAB50375.1 Na+/H+ antiporter subunit [Pyrococcus abyssi GE5]CCE70920.1 TPA: monovalent cation/proton antiporter, MnhG/PhaG subunit subfamily [Pyrococcus abyssi GE5]
MSILFYIGSALIVIGALCDLFGALGLLRFPNFYVRLHAATVGTIGGAVVPLLGVSLVAVSLNLLAIAGASFITAIIILLAAPAGAHALAYAAHRSGIVKWKPKVDHLAEARGDD